MSTDRFVVLGLAQVRSAWFREVARWATTGAIPLDFVKCMSVEELRARLGSGRAFSAVLADASIAGVDRDLVDQAREIGCAVVLVDDGGSRRDSGVLGVSTVLAENFDTDALLNALDQHTSMIGDAVADSRDLGIVGARAESSGLGWRGRVIAVTGAGGTGSSVTAIAAAQGLAADVRHHGRVLLADLALDADQAMLHDARDIVPGVQELIDAFRHGVPSPDEIRRLTFGDGHPYRVLLGLRRHRDWTALRPRAWHAALDGLRRTFTRVVADIDPDIEGERECGSLDVEERNLLARSVVDVAEVVVVTGHPGIQGLHRLVRNLSGLLDYGVPGDRLLPVITRAPRSSRGRAEIARTLALLRAGRAGDDLSAAPSPLFVPENRRLDGALRDGVGVPAGMATLIASGVQAVLERAGEPAVAADPEPPVPVTPGSLGSWVSGEEAVG